MRIARVDPFVLKIRGVEEFAGTAGAVPATSSPASTPPAAHEYARIGAYRSLFSRDVETMMVRIQTDTGIVGYGEAQAPIIPEVPKLIVEKLFRPILVGADPFESQVLWHKLYDGTRERGHGTGFMLDALSAV